MRLALVWLNLDSPVGVSHGVLILARELTDAGIRRVGIVGATTPGLPFISSPRGVEVDDDLTTIIQAEVDALIDGIRTARKVFGR